MKKRRLNMKFFFIISVNAGLSFVTQVREIIDGQRTLAGAHELSPSRFTTYQHEEDAEDAAQDAVIKAYNGLKISRETPMLCTWVISIALD